MSEEELERLRELSQAAFGQRYRAELMIAIGESSDGLVCLTDVARDLDVTVSNLQIPWKSLVATRLLNPMPRSDSRRRWFVRRESAAWTWALELGHLACAVPTTDRASSARQND